MSTRTENIDLKQFDNDFLNDLGANLNESSEKYETFLATLPILLENLSQALIFVEECQKRLCGERLLLQQDFDVFDFAKSSTMKQSLANFSNEFLVLYRSNNHLTTFAENLKELLIRGECIQRCDASQLNGIDEMMQRAKKIRTSLIEQFSSDRHAKMRAMEHSLIVSKQPPPVLKVGNCFETEVRLLADLSPMLPPFVRIRIISAGDAEKLASRAISCQEIFSPITLVENRASLIQNGEIWTSEFKKKPLLKAFVHCWQDDKEKQATVDQKYVVLYEIFLEHNNGEETLATADRIWATSFPVALIYNFFPYCDGYARIIWNREFNDEETVEWQKLAIVLKKIFFYFTGATKRGLSDCDLQLFRQKLGVVSDTDTVTFQRFSKDAIEDSEFSFWAWFYGICEKIKENLLPYWEKGYLMGFEKRKSLADRLSKQDQCFFLLRFSDSKLGTLTISLFDFDKVTGERRHTPYLLPADDDFRCFVKLLDNYDPLRTIDCFCDKDFYIIDKRRFLDDADLNEELGQSEASAATNVPNMHSINITNTYLQCIDGFWQVIQTPLQED